MVETKTAMTVRDAVPGARIIDIKGEVTANAESALTSAFTEASDGDTRAVILNFEGLDYMNSGGIGLLVTVLIRANRAGQKLLAVGLSDHYQEIFALTRLDEAIVIYDDEHAATAGL
jgi:anti-sigma B factor antagonist